MLILFVGLTPTTKIEEGNKYFVRDAKEAALLVQSVKGSTPNPEGVSSKLFNIDFETKNITQMSIPKVVFALD